VFEHLHTIYAAFDGRIKADQFRRQVMAVTTVWEAWMVFNNHNVEAWNKTFLGRVEEKREAEEIVLRVVEMPVEKKRRWKSVAETSGKESIELKKEMTEVGGFTAVPLNSGDGGGDVHGKEMVSNFDGKPMQENVDTESMDDVDGKPMDDDEDVDGIPMDEDVDGIPMDEDTDVDGVAMEEDEDVDGVPMDEDVDGASMEEDGLPTDQPQSSELPGKEDHPELPIEQHRDAQPQEAPQSKTEPPPRKRQRMKAADLFG
jgi:U2-associated protein SR140